MTPPGRILLLVLAASFAALAGCASSPAPPTPALAGCDGPAAFAEAAQANGASLTDLAFAPFGRAERGWETYAPAVASAIGAACPAGSAGFAASLAGWQKAHRLIADGRMDTPTFLAIKTERQNLRPFLAVRAQGICPDPPPPEALSTADPAEAAGGRPMLLRAGALAAYRAMVAAARAEVPGLAGDPDALKLTSAYRSPAYDDARCAREQDCQGITRAQCSAHRTGLALDLIVGFVPGHGADSSDDDNRRFQSQTAAYRWLVVNAGRFGFVNYLFEPWHWEWTGEAAVRDVPARFRN